MSILIETIKYEQKTEEYMENIESKFRKALEENTGADFDDIESRRCSSDSSDGIEYSFRGRHIPVLPIIKVIARKNNLRIESMSHIDRSTKHNDIDSSELVVFVTEKQGYEIKDAFI